MTRASQDTGLLNNFKIPPCTLPRMPHILDGLLSSQRCVIKEHQNGPEWFCPILVSMLSSLFDKKSDNAPLVHSCFWLHSNLCCTLNMIQVLHKRITSSSDTRTNQHPGQVYTTLYSSSLSFPSPTTTNKETQQTEAPHPSCFQ